MNSIFSLVFFGKYAKISAILFQCEEPGTELSSTSNAVTKCKSEVRRVRNKLSGSLISH